MKKLESNQMVNLSGGGDVLTDAQSCNDLANGLGGAALIWGAASIWAGGFGALAILAGSAVAYGLSLHCQTLE